MSDHMQRPCVCYRDLKTSTQNYIHRVWQETWDQQVLNKLHSIHPSTSHWAALPVRRHDIRLTRLRIGHTRFTHRHLLLGENAPECPLYGSARASVLKRLDTIHHSALRICSGAFRTSPVTAFNGMPPTTFRTKAEAIMCQILYSCYVCSHPLKPFALAIGLNRLYEARSFNIKPFSERAKAVLNDAHLNHINIQENNIFAFPPWDIQIFNYHNPFSGYDKADTAAVIYQQLFYFHRNRYSKYIPVDTDGSKNKCTCWVWCYF
ncbi:RNase H domain-containing protein [Trichonephila clavipes]|nr:RNase H domain-containing protein [Trichonephila clavipes]